MNAAWKPILSLLLISIATFVLYLRTLTFDFVSYDDGVYVTENPVVRAGLTWEGVKYAFTTGETGTWQPLALLSHMLDATLFGARPAGHHATSALLHALNTFLLGLALLRMTGAYGPSLFVAGVFGLHPLHVESVAWISERKDVLSTFFFMAALCVYAHWAQTLRKSSLALATLLMALGLLAKPMIVTLPFVLLLLDYWPLRRVHHERRLRCVALLAAEKLPMFVLAGAASAITLAVQRAAYATSSLAALPLSHRVENAVAAYVRYLGKLFWPSELLMYYPHPRGGLSTLAVGAAVIFLVVVTGMAWGCRRRAPYWIVGWLWYVGTLVPVIGIVQVGGQAIADRYMYIPMVGILIALCWGMGDLLARTGSRVLSTGVPVAATAVLIALAALTWKQTGVWRDSKSLFRHTLDIMPDNPFAAMGLGVLYVDEGKYGDAIPFLEIAVLAKHCEPEARYHLGIAHQQRGEFQIAADQYRAAVALNPAYSQAWNNLGVTLDALNQPAEALNAFARAVEADPLNEEAAGNQVRYLARLGRFEEARTCALAAAARMPQSSDLKELIHALGAVNSPK